MRRSTRTGTCLLLAGTLAIAGCKVKEAEPEADDRPRSIFRDEPAENPVLPAPTLPPLEMTLSFADGTPELTEAVRAELATIMDSPQVEAGGPIILRGHSDSEGSDEENLDSSRKRAEAVRDFLVESGIAEGRIRVIAFGEQNPVAPNALPDGSPNEEGRAQNRRVEVTVATGSSGERQQTLIESLTEPATETGSAAGKTATPKAKESPAQ